MKVKASLCRGDLPEALLKKGNADQQTERPEQQHRFWAPHSDQWEEREAGVIARRGRGLLSRKVSDITKTSSALGHRLNKPHPCVLDLNPWPHCS